jgi:hypothetical protein
MSDYLIREIKRAGNITVRPRTEVVGAAGTGRLQALVLQETSLPGVFAAGDVRPGSAKRVASAVGEGAVTVQLITSIFSMRRAWPGAAAQPGSSQVRRNSDQAVHATGGGWLPFGQRASSVKSQASCKRVTC